MRLIDFIDYYNFLFIADVIIIILIGIIHLVFYFYVKQSDFDNLFDTYESSPLFGFNLVKADNCGTQSSYTFQVWDGWEERGKGRYADTKTVDKTNLNKLNQYLFCYDYKSYKDLLYNGHIISRTCPDEFSNDCGIIDTLNQHLCIERDNDCPLYEVGLGQISDTRYVYNEEAKIYYSNNNDETNKKIIGKLILNDGQPCYKISEKLWRSFDDEEAIEEHLECELEIFGKTIDDRFDDKGEISYRTLYNDNLPRNRFNQLKDKLNDDLKVHLYSRVFLGIDLECDKRYNIKREDYENLRKNQKMEKACILVESIIIFSCFFLIILFFIIDVCSKKKKREATKYLITFIIIACLLSITVCFICHAVFLGQINNNDIFYDCSDHITNEVFKQEHLNTNKTKIFTAINLVLDLLIFLFNAILILNYYIKMKCGKNEIDITSINEKPNIFGNNKANIAIEKNFNADRINNYPQREVVVDNRTSIQEKGYSYSPNYPNFNNNYYAPNSNNNYGGYPNYYGVQGNLGPSSGTKF